MTLKIEYTPLLQKTKDCRAKTVVHVGGAGSSKSHSIAQLLIYKLTNEQHKTIGICRKTFPALRMTAMKLILDLMKDYGIYNPNNHNKTANTYSCNTNTIQFFSLDEVEKIKSANFSYIWMEECNELAYSDYIILKLRLRVPTKDGEINQMFLSCNPVDAHSWVAALCGDSDASLQDFEE